MFSNCSPAPRQRDRDVERELKEHFALGKSLLCYFFRLNVFPSAFVAEKGVEYEMSFFEIIC